MTDDRENMSMIDVILCYAILCYVILCYFILCYLMFSYDTQNVVYIRC